MIKEQAIEALLLAAERLAAESALAETSEAAVAEMPPQLLPSDVSNENEVPASSVRIVLCMIVKNEAAIISRCLESALPHVDGYVICDTGSEDRTIGLIEQAARKYRLSGRVLSHEWKNFGYNRTLAAAEARNWVSERGWSPAGTYLLFLDADMILHVERGFDRAALRATSYQVAQDDGTLRYYNTRLARLSSAWRSVGVTHEYWEPVDDPAIHERLDSVWIEDVGDGGSKSQKFERDIRLLTEGLASEPNNVRYMFYLAQSLQDGGRHAEAFDAYERRRQAGGWEEERWYAHYRQGLCLFSMGEPERAVGVLLDAFQERPSRAEPLHAIARRYREQGKNQLAVMFALRALEIPYPHGDLLFVSRIAYEWQLWEEVMISAFYVGSRYHPLGLQACERLLARRGHEGSFYEYVARNEAFYITTCDGLRQGIFAVPKEIRTEGEIVYACSNPAAVAYRGEMFVNVRLVNYQQERARVFRISAPDGIVRTRNVTLRWDPETGRASGERKSSPGVQAEWASGVRIQGLEDVRWVVHEDRVWLSATCCQVPGHEGFPQVVLGRMNESLDTVEHLVHLAYKGSRDVEKNWTLWSKDGVLYAIYAYDPLVVMQVDTDSGRCTLIAGSRPSRHTGRFRGSASPIAVPGFSGRFVALVHEVADYPEERVYTHRWVELNDQFELVAYSRPFFFDHRGIEFGVGLVGVDDKRLIVTYGHEDREARWIEFGWEPVLRALDMRRPEFEDSLTVRS
jgi:glycosyltransferase involved in cell wall biosynthesis